MGFKTIKAIIKDYRIILLFVCTLFLSTQIHQSCAAKDSERKINCRKYVYAPQCRGVAAKRDTGRFNDEYRLLPLLERDIPGMDRQTMTEVLNTRSLLGELLRKAMETPPEYDNEASANYLK